MRIGFSCCTTKNMPSSRGSAGSRPSVARTCSAGDFSLRSHEKHNVCDAGAHIRSHWIPAFAGMTGKICGMTMIVIAVLFIALPSFATPTATDRKTVSSKAYVDTNVELKQPKIPAANPNNATIGVSVVTYTGNEGVIGERQIYDGSNTYTNGDANKLVTASALNGTVTNLPTMETSKLTCANPGTCSLWTIVDQQVYGQQNSNSGD